MLLSQCQSPAFTHFSPTHKGGSRWRCAPRNHKTSSKRCSNYICDRVKKKTLQLLNGIQSQTVLTKTTQVKCMTGPLLCFSKKHNRTSYTFNTWHLGRKWRLDISQSSFVFKTRLWDVRNHQKEVVDRFTLQLNWLRNPLRSFWMDKVKKLESIQDISITKIPDNIKSESEAHIFIVISYFYTS